MVFRFNGHLVFIILTIACLGFIFYGTVSQCKIIFFTENEPSKKEYIFQNRDSTIQSSNDIINTNRSMDAPLVLTFHDNQWMREKLCTHYKDYNNRKDFQLHDFRTDAGTVKLFTYDSGDFISSQIIKTGAFEVGTINRVLHELKKDSRLNLIDIGTNIGQHCVAAALIGRESLAIDGSKGTLEHLCASVQYLNMTNKIIMIDNIMSNTKGERTVRYSASNKDFGSTFVELDDIHDKKMIQIPEVYWNRKTVRHDAVALDSFLDLPFINRFQRVLVKMDVEGHEDKVLQGGVNFFDKMHVAGVIMEWIWHKNRKSGNFIKSFMEKRGFKPYELPRTKPYTISDQNPQKWPQDVLWLPY